MKKELILTLMNGTPIRINAAEIKTVNDLMGVLGYTVITTAHDRICVKERAQDIREELLSGCHSPAGGTNPAK